MQSLTCIFFCMRTVAGNESVSLHHAVREDLLRCLDSRLLEEAI